MLYSVIIYRVGGGQKFPIFALYNMCTTPWLRREVGIGSRSQEVSGELDKSAETSAMVAGWKKDIVAQEVWKLEAVVVTKWWCQIELKIEVCEFCLRKMLQMTDRSGKESKLKDEGNEGLATLWFGNSLFNLAIQFWQFRFGNSIWQFYGNSSRLLLIVFQSFLICQIWW